MRERTGVTDSSWVRPPLYVFERKTPVWKTVWQKNAWQLVSRIMSSKGISGQPLILFFKELSVISIISSIKEKVAGEEFCVYGLHILNNRIAGVWTGKRDNVDKLSECKEGFFLSSKFFLQESIHFIGGYDAIIDCPNQPDMIMPTDPAEKTWGVIRQEVDTPGALNLVKLPLAWCVACLIVLGVAASRWSIFSRIPGIIFQCRHYFPRKSILCLFIFISVNSPQSCHLALMEATMLYLGSFRWGLVSG